MSEPRKLAVIGHCAQCQHYRYRSHKFSGACGKEGKEICSDTGRYPTGARCLMRRKGATVANYWISFIQPTEDYRPMTHPPNEQILGWWCSGYDSDDNPVLCALVRASSDLAAKLAIAKDWPEAMGWRFCNEKPDGWLPGDRFPLADWMQARIGGGDRG